MKRLEKLAIADLDLAIYVLAEIRNRTIVWKRGEEKQVIKDVHEWARDVLAKITVPATEGVQKDD